MMRDDTNLAIFQCTTDALRFSYRHAQGDYPSNPMGQWQPRESGEGRLPRGLDAATLAGWVRGVVEGGNGLPGMLEPYRSIILARHCTKSEINLPAKMRVLEDVLVFAMGTGLHNRRMVDLLIQRHFNGKVKGRDGVWRPIRQGQIADQCDVSQSTISVSYAKIRPWLADKERLAMEMLDRALQKRGYVN